VDLSRLGEHLRPLRASRHERRRRRSKNGSCRGKPWQEMSCLPKRSDKLGRLAACCRSPRIARAIVWALAACRPVSPDSRARRPAVPKSHTASSGRPSLFAAPFASQRPTIGAVLSNALKPVTRSNAPPTRKQDQAPQPCKVPDRHCKYGRPHVLIPYRGLSAGLAFRPKMQPPAVTRPSPITISLSTTLPSGGACVADSLNSPPTPPSSAHHQHGAVVTAPLCFSIHSLTAFVRSRRLAGQLPTARRTRLSELRGAITTIWPYNGLPSRDFHAPQFPARLAPAPSPRLVRRGGRTRFRQVMHKASASAPPSTSTARRCGPLPQQASGVVGKTAPQVPGPAGAGAAPGSTSVVDERGAGGAGPGPEISRDRFEWSYLKTRPAPLLHATDPGPRIGWSRSRSMIPFPLNRR